MIDLALDYAARGWPVFPIEARGKQPLGRLVPHGLKDASVDPVIIRRWWNAVPDANIGLPTGIMFDVADLDSNAALTRFLEFCKEHGTDPRSFPRARTGGGGRHLFMRPTGLGNRARILPEMDWRGRGGYIVAPGSTHQSGNLYEWMAEPTDALPECPQWLLDILQPARVIQIAGGASNTADRILDLETPYVRAAVDSELETVASASEGTRNDTLNRASFALGQMVAAGWVARHIAEAELRACAFRAGLTEPEVTKTIQSGMSSGMEHPRTPPSSAGRAGGVILHGRHRNGSHPDPEPEPEEQDLSGFDALVESGPLWASRAGEIVPAIIRGVLVAGGLGMLISDPKAGKTWLVLELCVSIASQTPAFGRYAVEQPGRILYIATEGTREGTLNRLRALSMGRNVDPDHVLNGMDFIWRRGVRLDDKAFAAWLLEQAAGYTLIVVDVLAEAWDGDENKAAQVSELMRRVRPVTDAGATVLLLHHLSKAQGEEMRSIWQRIRGSTALFGAFDSGIGLERSPSASRTKVTFQHRDDAPADAFTFTWPTQLVDGNEGVTLDWQLHDEGTEAGREMEDKILRWVVGHPGQAKTDIYKAVPGKTATKIEALDGLIAHHRVWTQSVSKRAGSRLYTSLLCYPQESSGVRVLGDGLPDDD